MQRRRGIRSNAFSTDVLIVDQQFTSNYFRVSEVPTELTAGKNMFKVYGNLDLLKHGSEISILITDSNNNPIYHQVENFRDQAGRALITMWVYPETPPGLGKITIRGIATKRPGGTNVPENWKDRVNVEWTRDVIVDPAKDNTTAILFKKLPSVSITEKVREYLNQSFVTGTAATSSNGHSSATISYTLGTDNFGYINSSEAIFTSDMENGYLQIPEPGYTLGSSLSLQSGETLEYTTYINQVINDTTIKVSPYTLDVQASGGHGQSDGPQGSFALTVATSTIFPDTFSAVSNFTMSWQQTPTLLNGGLNSQSYASIVLKDLKPMTGRINSIKTFMKSHGVSNYTLVDDSVLRNQDLLVDYNSTEAYFSVGNIRNQNHINTYWEVEVVDNFSLVGGPPAATYGDILTTTPGASAIVDTEIIRHDDSMMISSMCISGSEFLVPNNAGYAAFQTTYPNAYIKVSNKTGINLYKDNEYKIGLKIVCEKTLDQSVNSKMDIYVSGSNLSDSDDRSIGHKIITLESAEDTVTSVTTFENVSTLMQSGIIIAPPVLDSEQSIDVPGQFITNDTQEISIVSSLNVDSRRLELLFEPTKDTTAHLVFAVTAGKWHISDVFVQGARDLGFTPNHTFLEIPLNTEQADDVLDFRFQFANPAGAIANISITTQSQDFVGGNLFISGPENQLSGSVIIGSGILMEGFN